MWNRFVQWLKDLFHRILFTRKEHFEELAALRYAYSEERNVLNAEIRSLRDQVDKLSVSEANLRNVILDATRDAAKVERELKSVNEELIEARSEIVQLRETPELQSEYLREVQIQLGSLLEGDEHYGYRNEFAIPGSICVVADDVVIDEQGFVDACGRVVIDDQTTKEINMEKTMYGKTAIVINYILRYGAMSRIIQNIVQRGAMQMTLAYRESTSTYECFFNVKAKSFEKESLITFNDETGAVVHRPGTKELEEKKEEGEA